MIEAYKKFFRNYANFKDRSTRKDYWLVILINIIIGFCVGLIGGFLGEEAEKVCTVVVGIYSLATLIPSLALEVRRLHDINKSGWFILISLVPAVGSIILLVFLCMDSVNENNQYGKIAE